MHDVYSIPSVTGVDLNLKIAGPGARSYAFVVDWHIRLLSALAWFVAGTLVLYGSLAIDFRTPDTVYTFGVIVPVAAIYFLYHPIIELLMSGRTPGKRIAGVRVVRTDGAIPGIGEILIRNVFRLIDSMPMFYCVGLAVTIISKNSLRIGDLAAGTLLVYDPPAARDLDALSGAALDSIGMDRTELVRDLLARWDRLDVSVRNDLARQLLTTLCVITPESHSINFRQELEAVLEP
jgi:uncharacterized RDD family membrane protein YckC